MLVFCLTQTPPPPAKVTPGFNHQSAQLFRLGSLTLNRFKSLVLLSDTISGISCPQFSVGLLKFSCSGFLSFCIICFLQPLSAIYHKVNMYW